MENITQKKIKEYLHYNNNNGVFTWIRKPTDNIKVGDIAGTTTRYGYTTIQFKKKKYLAHRLAYLYVVGVFPKYEIDHINRIRSDNKWENLRDVPHIINQGNRGNAVSFSGVSWCKREGKWRSQKNGRVTEKNRHLGYFKTHLAACYARHAYEVINNA